MKKKFCLAIVFCYISFCSAQSHIIYPQDGIYGGVESGVALVNLNGTFDSFRSNPDNNEYLGNDYTKSVIGVNLGFGMYLSESFLGLEMHHSLYTKKINDTFTQGDFDFNINVGNKSEIDLILGRKIGTKSLLTARIGFALSNISVRADYNLGAENYNLTEQWNGFSLGMGYVYGITDQLAFKTKYNLTTFKNQQFPQTKSKLVDNRFTLSFIYSIWIPEQ